MFPDGDYALPFGEHVRLIRIRTMGNRRVVYYKAARWKSFAFLLDDSGEIQMHKLQEHTWSKNQIESARSAVRDIAKNHKAARALFKQILEQEGKASA